MHNVFLSYINTGFDTYSNPERSWHVADPGAKITHFFSHREAGPDLANDRDPDPGIN